jgi:putative chitinase
MADKTKFFFIDDIEIIDLDALVKLIGGGAWNPWSTRGRYIAAMLTSHNALHSNEVNSPLRLAHFIAQGLIETGFLRYSSESLKYSARRLVEVFPGHYPTLEDAEKEAGDEKKIANRVYGGRLGNIEPDDGWTYRGRGFFQVTGRGNYRRYGEIAAVDLAAEPDLLAKDLALSIRVAAAYWKSTGLGPYADADDGRAVSRGVNRGNPLAIKKAHGEALRLEWTRRVIGLFSGPARVLVVDALADGVLDIGEQGAAVRELQEKLKRLGYLDGKADGKFGVKTSRAVIAFQSEHGLSPADGRATEVVRTAIDEALKENRDSAASNEAKRLKVKA